MQIVSEIRKTMESLGFIEVETPVLQVYHMYLSFSSRFFVLLMMNLLFAVLCDDAGQAFSWKYETNTEINSNELLLLFKFSFHLLRCLKTIAFSCLNFNWKAYNWELEVVLLEKEERMEKHWEKESDVSEWKNILAYIYAHWQFFFLLMKVFLN